MNWTIISTEQEYERALERLEDIFDSTPNDSTFKEAELLTMLIENYELESEPLFPNPDPIEVIKFKMEQKNMRNKDLAEIIGGKSKASEILNKKRRLTLKMIRQINKFLGIPAEVLIGEYELVK
jgi:HTH-type transcriptional regulator/antitoxin HigA